MDKPESNDLVSCKGLKREHVLVALWYNASGTGNTSDRGEAMRYLATALLSPPTMREATIHLAHTKPADIFHGRIISGSFTKDDSYFCAPYNTLHGPNRAQRVVDALRTLPTIDFDAIRKVYVSVLDEVSKRDGAQMLKLLGDGKTTEVSKIRSCLLVRQDADGSGLMMADATTPQQILDAQDVVRDFLRQHLMTNNIDDTHKAKATEPVEDEISVNNNSRGFWRRLCCCCTSEEGKVKSKAKPTDPLLPKTKPEVQKSKYELTGDYATDVQIMRNKMLDEMFQRAAANQASQKQQQPVN
jgi:hypothetical protein